MKNLLALILLFLLLMSSCKKTEGVGGRATIKGSVLVEHYSNAGNYKGNYDAQNQKVYIIYGDTDEIVGDNVSTSYDGTYQFDYLQKGTYKIFVYSSCVDCFNKEDSVVMQTVIINERKEVIEAIDFVITD